MIRLVKKEDLKLLAPIYKDLYDNANIGEDWSIEKSREEIIKKINNNYETLTDIIGCWNLYCI